METGIHELTAGYALDALDPEERDAYEDHLAGCASCQEELAGFWEVTDALAMATAGPAPSIDLRERILGDVRAERKDNVVELSSRRRPLTPVLAAATAIAAAVAIGLGIQAVTLDGRLDDTRTALASQQSAASVLADPGARTIALEAGTGHLVVRNDGAAVLVFRNPGRLPSGKTYMAWVLDAGERAQPAGTFTTTDGAAVVPIGRPVGKNSIVGVTIEDDPEATQPTLPMVAASSPA